MKTIAQKSILALSPPGYLVDLLALSAFTLLTFSAFYAPRLALDDWSLIVNDYRTGRMAWFVWTRARPIDWATYKLILSIFGLNIPAFYIINAIILFLIPAMVYGIIARLWPGQRAFALAAAALAALYPADASRMWITMVNIHLGWLVTLVGMALLLEYALGGRLVLLLLSAACLTLPLLNYEGQLGVAAAGCLFAALAIPNIPLRRRLATLSPLILLALFTLMRVVVRPSSYSIVDGYTTQFFQLTPQILVQRIGAIFTTLAAGWTQVFPPLLHRLGLPRLPAGQILAALLALTAGSGLAVLWLARRSAGAYDSYTWEERARVRNGCLLALLAGLLFIFAGYIPVITVRAPNLDGFSSRANLFALPGAAILICSLLGLIGISIAKSHRQWQGFLLGACLPLALAAVVSQLWVQLQGRQIWNEQKQLWREVFTLAPDLADGATVVFVLPGYTGLKFAEQPPLIADWEADYALKVLYGSQGLTGRIYFPDIDVYSEAILAPEGLKVAWKAEITPYDRVVFMRYSPQKHKVKILENPSAELRLGFQMPSYSPESWILAGPAPAVRDRGLVGSGP